MASGEWFTLRDTKGCLHLCWQESADGVPYVGGQLHTIAEIHEEEHAPKITAANDMYEALEEAIALIMGMDSGVTQKDIRRVSDIIDRAQRKARGED